MKPSLILLSLTNLAVMAIAAVTGLLVEGQHGYLRHSLLGVLTGLFTCLVHVIVFVYFIVQEKVFSQSVRLSGLEAGFAIEVRQIKLRVLLLSLCGIGSVHVVVGLGAVIDIYLGASPHAVAAFACLALNAFLFVRHYMLVDRYGRTRDRAFGAG